MTQETRYTEREGMSECDRKGGNVFALNPERHDL